MMVPVIYLTYAQVVGIHEAATGIQGGVADPGLIESACARPRATVFGEDAYPSVWEKAAALLHSLARNHAFVDGNKRAAWVATLAFLDVNGHPLRPDYDDDLDAEVAENLVLAVATGALSDVAAIAGELAAFVKFTI